MPSREYVDFNQFLHAILHTFKVKNLFFYKAQIFAINSSLNSNSIHRLSIVGTINFKSYIEY